MPRRPRKIEVGQFYHIYNRTVASERIVEIPIAKKILDDHIGKEILEVGNVMPHYYKIEHDVLDKYEKARGVINEDVISFNPKKKYDLIMSVSTLEHVGFSYGENKDTDKFLKGVNNLKKSLKPNGLLFATFPLYLTPGIDRLFKANKMPFEEEYFMKRISYLNEWRQISKKESKKERRYDSRFANANILYLGYYRKNN